MRTIGRRYRRKAAGDYLARCDECLAPEVRSKLVRRRDGLLYHRMGDCQPSMTAIELSEGNATAAARSRTLPPIDGGNQ